MLLTMLLSPALVTSNIGYIKQSVVSIGFSNKREEHRYKIKKSESVLEWKRLLL